MAVTSAVFLLSWASVSAHAADFKIRNCHSAETGQLASGTAWGWVADQRIEFANSCPTGLRFRVVSPLSPATSREARISLGSDVKINKATFSVETTGPSGGVSFGVAACAGCDPVKYFDVPVTGTSSQQISVDLEGSNTIGLTVRCGLQTCDSGSTLRAHSFEFEAADQVAPITSATVTTSWVRSHNLNYSFSARDSGVGLGAVNLTTTASAMPVYQHNGCSQFLAVPEKPFKYVPFGCTTQLSGNGALKIGSATDGTYELVLEAADALGNVAPRVARTFKIDDTPPSTPEDVTVEPVVHRGWTTNSRVAAKWRNVGEEAPTNNHSGIFEHGFDLEPRSGQSVDPPAVTRSVWWQNSSTIEDIWIPEDGDWDLYVWTVDAVGNISGRQKVRIGRDLDVPQPPTLDSVTWINRQQLLSGASVGISDPSDSRIDSGICGYAVGVTSSPGSTPSAQITDWAPLSAIPLDRRLTDGNLWLNVRSVSCAGIASSTARTTLQVDTVDPVVTVTGNRDGQWLGAGDKLRVNVVENGSGIDRIAARTDNSASVELDTQSSNIPLEDGVHRVTLTASDVAGNPAAPVSIDYKRDVRSPIGTFLPRRDSDPTLLRGWVSDAASGVASVEVSIRNRSSGDENWMKLPTAVVNDLLDPTRLEFTARVPDEDLSAGTYEVRALVTDAVGNTAVVSDQASTGVGYSIALPVRDAVFATASIAPVERRCVALRKRGCKSRNVCAGSGCRLKNVVATARASKSLTIGWADRTVLLGSLKDRLGHPVPGAVVTVRSAPPGQPTRVVGAVVTDGRGDWSFPVPTGSNRRFTVVSAGTATMLPASATADLGVKASAVLRMSARWTKSGRTVTFFGRLKGLDSAASPRGVVVDFRFKNGRKWQSGLGVKFVSGDGRFSLPYEFRNVPGSAGKYQIRGVIHAEDSNWPFQDGVTNVLRVRTRR